MDGVTLIAEARAVGLMVRADGEKLVIRGPQTAKAVVRRLIASKPLVMEALAEPVLPPRPPVRPGHVAELARRNGRWIWRQHQMVAADRAYAAWVAARRPANGNIPSEQRGEETAVERAERYRIKWERSGYPPGVTPKGPETPSNDSAGS